MEHLGDIKLPISNLFSDDFNSTILTQTFQKRLLENPILIDYCKGDAIKNIVGSGGGIGGGLGGISGNDGHDTLIIGSNSNEIIDDPNQNSNNRTNNAILMNVFIILYCLVFLIGLFGNSLVIYVVLRFSKMQTVTNMYIFNLAIADEMFLFGLIFLIVTFFQKYWMFGRILCKIYMTMTSINQFTSSLLLTVMSADRYVAVCHPIEAPRWRTPFIAKFVCLTVWTISALLMVPIFMYGNTLEYKNTVTCNIIWPESEPIKGARTFTLYSFTLGFFIPFILIFLFYILVICRLRSVGPKKKSKEKKRSHRKVTYLVLTVISVYVLCCLPYWIGQLYITFVFTGDTRFTVIFNLLAGVLTYANSAINPILYAFLSENFKKSFAKAFTCASGKDINSQLNVENSNFPQRIQTHSNNKNQQKQQQQFQQEPEPELEEEPQKQQEQEQMMMIIEHSSG